MSDEIEPIEETIAEEKLTCPYCGCKHDLADGEFQIDDSDGSTAEVDCVGCDKKFHATLYINYEFWGKPDCVLNGQKHKYEGNRFGPGSDEWAYFCVVCHDCKSPRHPDNIEAAKTEGHTFGPEPEPRADT